MFQQAELCITSDRVLYGQDLQPIRMQWRQLKNLYLMIRSIHLHSLMRRLRLTLKALTKSEKTALMLLSTVMMMIMQTI